MWNVRRRARLSQILDLFVEESQLNVYAGELEVRPPGAPTTQARFDGSDGVRRLVNTRLFRSDADDRQRGRAGQASCEEDSLKAYHLGHAPAGHRLTSP